MSSIVLFGGGGYRLRNSNMQRLDGHYLYEVGHTIHPIAEFATGAGSEKAVTFGEAFYTLYIAESALDKLLNQSIYQLKTSRQSGLDLVEAIRAIMSAARHSGDATNLTSHVPFELVYAVKSALTSFEAVLKAELSLVPMYLVTPKGGFNLPTMVDSGELCFPSDLPALVPEAVFDLQQGARCIAFELPTAAAFHLHRANESVLLRYWDIVSGGTKRPKSKNMGVILAKMKEKHWGDVKVRSALEDLKNFHRNPVIHPEDTLETVDEAIALMNNIHTVVVQMLKKIRTPKP